MFFLTPNRNMFTRKFVRSEKLLAVLREHIIFYVKLVEVRKMSEVFWAKLYCRISDLFSSFLKSVLYTGTCGRILFSKKEFQIWDFESHIFWSSFVFQGTALGRFSHFFFFFFIFYRRPTMVADGTSKKRKKHMGEKQKLIKKRDNF